MGFLLEIDYTSKNYNTSSYENLFLSEGWGRLRDVRGPYMTRPRAAIEIPKYALSNKIKSHLQLQFGLSNRSPVEAMIFNLIGNFGTTSHIVQRNSDINVNIDNIFLNENLENYSLEITLYTPLPSQIFEFMDILSINRLSIRRGGVR